MMKMPDIDLKDVERAARTMFHDADVDRNGIATPAEVDQIVKTRRDDIIRRRFADLDRNGDKTIDFGEFYAWQDGLGTRAHDDQGSRTYEMTSVPDAVPVPRGKGDDAEFLGMLMVPVSRMTLIEANANYDEGVDLAEFVAFQRRAFDAADSDGNGRLQGDEVRRLLDSRRPTRTCVVAAQLPAPNGGPDGPPPPPGPGCERR